MMLTGNPPQRRWLLSKPGRSSWYSYYEDVVKDAVRDGWTAKEETWKDAYQSAQDCGMK